MKTTPEALKALYQTLGGSSGNVAGESKTTGILNKIAALFGSTATADKIPDAIDNINAVASGITKPSGKITITENATDINVASYATADVNVAGGSSDFSTATMTVLHDVQLGVPLVFDDQMGSCLINLHQSFRAGEYQLALYKGVLIFGCENELYTFTGNATNNEGIVTVTGDFTVDISAS